MRNVDTTSGERLRVAIIGGGFSGTVTTVQLLRMNPSASLAITLIEQRANIAQGVAYRTNCPLHLLNVTADRMSAFEDEPNSFLSFAKQKQADIQPHDFAPRMLYCAYLTDTLNTALQEK